MLGNDIGVAMFASREFNELQIQVLGGVVAFSSMDGQCKKPI